MNWSDFFTFAPDSGVLTWIVTRGPNAQAGQEAGSVKHDGRYRSVVLKRKRYYVHRIAWEISNGPIAEGLCIDHIDGNGLNNVLSNLRVTTLSLNQRNRAVAKNSRTGITGVVHHKNGFAVSCAGKYVGHFPRLEDAIEARRAAEPVHGYITNDRRSSHANS